MYLLSTHGDEARLTGRVVNLLGGGTILREVIKAAERLSMTYDVTCRVWSVTSFTELAREGLEVARWNMLHPDQSQRESFVATRLSGEIPVIAASDYMKLHAESIRSSFDAPYRVLGTDGFGRSDSRKALRSHFEVDERYITLAALKELADAQVLSDADVAKAIVDMDIDPAKPEPRHA